MVRPGLHRPFSVKIKLPSKPSNKAGKFAATALTYLPHKAAAEVSKDKEPIGRECAEFNWFESQLMSNSNELRVK